MFVLMIMVKNQILVMLLTLNILGMVITSKFLHHTTHSNQLTMVGLVITSKYLDNILRSNNLTQRNKAVGFMVGIMFTRQIQKSLRVFPCMIQHLRGERHRIFHSLVY